MKLKKLLFLLPILIFLFGISFIDTQALIEQFGEQNSYILMFFLALIGGLSIFSAVPYPLFLITFALAGLNPVVLALCSASGVMLGDSSSYLLGRKSEKLFHGKSKHIFEVLLSFYDSKKRVLPFLFFLYGMFSPFPNDLITLSAGMKKYSYVKMILPLTLGNIIFCLVLGYFADFFAVYFS